MKRQTLEELQAHLAKMNGIHGDEPIRMKIARVWLEEVIESRLASTAVALVLGALTERQVEILRYALGLDGTHAWHERNYFCATSVDQGEPLRGLVEKGLMRAGEKLAEYQYFHVTEEGKALFGEEVTGAARGGGSTVGKPSLPVGAH